MPSSSYLKIHRNVDILPRFPKWYSQSFWVIIGCRRAVSLEKMYRPANDPQMAPHIISGPEIISRLHHEPRPEWMKKCRLTNLESGFKVYIIDFFCYCETQ